SASSCSRSSLVPVTLTSRLSPFASPSRALTSRNSSASSSPSAASKSARGIVAVTLSGKSRMWTSSAFVLVISIWTPFRACAQGLVRTLSRRATWSFSSGARLDCPTERGFCLGLFAAARQRELGQLVLADLLGREDNEATRSDRSQRRGARAALERGALAEHRARSDLCHNGVVDLDIEHAVKQQEQ